MTTPGTMNRILENIREALSSAEEDAAESHKVAMNSYGAGYDAGYAAALKWLLMEITGDAP